MIASITSYSTNKYVLWANKWCSVIQWYQPRCLLHLWPNTVTLWATIAIHLWPNTVQYGWKTCFDDANLHKILFYTQICYKGQCLVFSYPMVSLKVPTRLMTPYNYSMDHHRYSFLSQNGRKWLENKFLVMLTSVTSFYRQIYCMGRWVVFSYLMVSGKVLTTLMTKCIYSMAHHSHLFMSKNCWKRFKTGFCWYLTP
jgi:hypothetical protein